MAEVSAKDMLANNGLYFQSGDLDDDGTTPINQCIGLACNERPFEARLHCAPLSLPFAE